MIEYDKFLFASLNPSRFFAVTLEENIKKKESYKIARKEASDIFRDFNKKTKLYRICPIFLSLKKEKGPVINLKLCNLNNLDIYDYLYYHSYFNIYHQLRNIYFIHNNIFIAKCDYLTAHAMVKIPNITKRYGIVSNELLCFAQYSKKEYLKKILILLRRKFHWNITQLIFSFITPVEEFFNINIYITNL